MSEETQSFPLVSVIIPMRNERDWIDRCMNTVLGQDYPADRMEILVADGMSDDGSREMLEAIARQDPRVRVFDNPDRIVPGGLNRLIRESRGEIIARIDAHTVLEKDFLRVGVATLQRTGAGNVGGPMVCRGGGPIADAIATAMHSRFGIGASFHFADREAECDTVYMGMWPKAVFARHGLFDRELVRNQDDEHSYRIRKGGETILVTPAMKSVYQNRESWRALLKQFFQYGMWKIRVLQKHPRQMSVRHFIPPAFQLFLLVCAAVAFAGQGSLAYFAGLAACGALLGYLVALVGIALVSTSGLAQRARAAAAFAIIHHAWAAGFLVGAVRFLPRWWMAEPQAPRLDDPA